MCGIFAFLGHHVPENVMKLNMRGPEKTTYEVVDNFHMVFHRLAINGLNMASGQPMRYRQYIFMCNGEIYNHKALWASMALTPTTSSDCEVIGVLIDKYGIMAAINMLDGVFAFIIYDTVKKCIYIGRDPLGVRPLMIFFDDSRPRGWSSDMKSIGKEFMVRQFPAGSYAIYDGRTYTEVKYWTPYSFVPVSHDGKIAELLMEAVRKRVENTDRPIACLLSGGLDSSLIASLVRHYYRGELETYSIGMEGSTDLKYARIMAAHLGSKHHEIVVSEADFLKAIPEVIYAIESYDTTTVRASVGNYLVCRYIRENSSAKVIFNGDGADELFGGYLYFHKAGNDYEFDMERRRLLADIAYFDVLRSDRTISGNGLEPRTPFLDRRLVQHVLSLYPNRNKLEKYPLRKAFEDVVLNHGRALPDKILMRRKEAFSDGVSSVERSWYKVIQEHVEKMGILGNGMTPEQRYYRTIFNTYYEGREHVIPYMWMPRFVEATDPSARTL
jgi:asparagine synthase (glutamine-hydrolysing)